MGLQIINSSYSIPIIPFFSVSTQQNSIISNSRRVFCYFSASEYINLFLYFLFVFLYILFTPILLLTYSVTYLLRSLPTPFLTFSVPYLLCSLPSLFLTYSVPYLLCSLPSLFLIYPVPNLLRSLPFPFLTHSVPNLLRSLPPPHLTYGFILLVHPPAVGPQFGHGEGSVDVGSVAHRGDLNIDNNL